MRRKRITNHDIQQMQQDLEFKLEAAGRLIARLEGTIRFHNHALARIIAKLDPLYGVDELDPRRQAESSAIGESVLKKLQAEIEAMKRLDP